MTREYFQFLRDFLFDKAFRQKHLETRKLGRLQRYTRTTTNLLGRPLEIADNASFLAMYKEVFENEIYKFKARTETPTIIDGGANIGMSAIYLKTLYPQAKITAFEPDQKIFGILRQNLVNFGFDDVELRQAALWSENTELSFLAEGADSGRVVADGEKEKISVEAVRLKDFLTQKVDFLKLDIEGAELEVLEDCAENLEQVENLFVEYHSFEGKPQKVDRLFNILLSAGFRVNARSHSTGHSPLYERAVYLGMDFQMDIFAYRENSAGAK